MIHRKTCLVEQLFCALDEVVRGETISLLVPGAQCSKGGAK